MKSDITQIRMFDDEYSFLSNFYLCAVVYQRKTYRSAEAAFQAAKCIIPDERTPFQSYSAAEAKKQGRKVTLRKDWDKVKTNIMYKIIKQKFFGNRILAEKLIATEDQVLIEGNYWHDNCWGDCVCKKCSNILGENILGKLLMNVRYELQSKLSKRKDGTIKKLWKEKSKMSYTYIFTFGREGGALQTAQIQNSWRGCMAIWSYLEEKYLPVYRPQFIPSHILDTQVEDFLGYKPSRCSAMFEKGAMEGIWNLANSTELSEHERIALFTTFDNCLIKKEDIPTVVAAFRKFEGKTSLPEQADVLEQLAHDENCVAVGWGISTCKSWDNWTYDESLKENIPYNCLTGKDHYWLFDKMDKAKN